jgi:hypothetical protein
VADVTEAEVLVWCLDYFKARDDADAALRCSRVRYSPITIRVAVALEALGLAAPDVLMHAHDVGS